jgi:hypothetical protein
MWRRERESTVPRANEIRGDKVWTVVSQVKLKPQRRVAPCRFFASLENEGRLNWTDVPYSSVTEKTHADYGTGTTTNADGTTLHYGNNLCDAKCLRGWMNLRKIQWI